MKNKISIIIVTYNSIKYLNNLFDSLVSQSYKNFDIYISDNNSSDETISVIKGKYDSLLDIKYSLNDSNLGFAKANNICITKAIDAGSDGVLLLNHDTVLENDVIEKCTEELFSNPLIGALVPTILYWKPNEEYIWWVGTHGRTIWDMVKNYSIKPTYHIHKNKKLDDIKCIKTQETEYLTGCAMFVKSEVIKNVGLLDEKYFMYFEDADWSMRIKKSGYKLYHLSTTIVYHNTPMIPKSGGISLKNKLIKYKRYITSLIRFFLSKKSLNYFNK